MFSIKQYNNKLNKSYQAEDMYQLWAEYRSQITNMLIFNSQSKLIIGAGHLNDIELRQLLSLTNDITLLDTDTEAVERGLEIQGISNTAVNIVERELTGLDSSLFFEKVLYLISSLDFQGIERFFNQIASQNIDIKLPKKFDHIVVSSIYTQLLLPQYYQIVNSIVNPSDQQKMMEPFMSFVSKVINSVNESILSAASKGARITCWSDVLEYKVGDPALLEITELLKNKDYQAINLIYSNYLEKYGYGLGSYGLTNMTNRLHMINEEWLRWPFSNSRTMLVKLVNGTLVSS